MRRFLPVLAALRHSRGFAFGIIYVGLLISFLAFAADQFGFGTSAIGFWGWRQIGGFSFGIGLVVVGLALSARLYGPGRSVAARRQLQRWWGWVVARRVDLLVGLLLLLIMLGGGAARFYRSYYGLPYLHIWDEPQTAHTALQMLKSGDYDPKFFNYGSLLTYLNLGVDILHYIYKMTVADEPDALRAVADIEMGPFGPWPAVGNYRWYVSHPSFYLWNRWMVGVFGVGIVALTYLLGARVYTRMAGLLAAAFLAGLGYHVLESSRITPDIPVSFFMLLSLVVSLGYLNTKQFRWLVGAACAGGLAIATKYNSAYVVLVPMVTLIATSRGEPWPARIRRVLLLPVIAVATFVLVTPYALINLPTFLNDAGFEVYHYTVDGHREIASIEPGLQQLAFQLGSYILNLSLPGVVLSLVGLPLLFRSSAGRLMVLLGALNLLLVTRTHVSFHRHLLVTYPIAAVAIGCALVWLTLQLWRALPRSGWATALRVAGALMVAGLVATPLVASLPVLARNSQLRETRTVAVDQVNALVAQHQLTGTVVGVASELQIHSLDLQRISADLFYYQAPAQQLICHQDQYSLLVLPTGATPAILGQYLASLDPARVVYARPVSPRIVRTSPIAHPEVAVVLGSADTRFATACDISADLARVTTAPLSPVLPYQDRPAVVMSQAGTLTTPFYNLGPGVYLAQVDAGGAPEAAAHPDVRVTILRRSGDTTTPLAFTTQATIGAGLATIPTRFTLSEPTQIAIQVAYEGAAGDAGQGADRNVYIAALRITRDLAGATVPRGAALLGAGDLPPLDNRTAATAQPCPDVISLLPTNGLTATYTDRRGEQWLYMTLRGALQTVPCQAAPGSYGFFWNGQGLPERGLLRATMLAFDAPEAPPRTLSSRILLASRIPREWYEIVDLDRPTVVALKVEWVDGPAYPGLERSEVRLPSTVQIRTHAPLQVRQAIEQSWADLVRNGLLSR